MTLKLADKWVWDFWTVRDGADFHIFYLQAPRSLGDPDLRHWHASIGHAVSQDLRNWTILPDALQHGPPGDWDDYTTWTGSALRHEGMWYLFYTGHSHADEGRVQRIGLATSADGIEWRKHPANPVIEADPRYYELPDLSVWHEQAWRDPYVVAMDDGYFHAFITARVNYGPSLERGVIGHARSRDLVQWEILPPVSEPGAFGHLEVPQWIELDGRYYMLFCTAINALSPTFIERVGVGLTGTHYLMSDQPLGPFRLTTDDFLVGYPTDALYVGKLLYGPDNELVFMAFHGTDANGTFVGVISDPYPVSVDAATGLLTVHH